MKLFLFHSLLARSFAGLLACTAFAALAQEEIKPTRTSAVAAAVPDAAPATPIDLGEPAAQPRADVTVDAKPATAPRKTASTPKAKAQAVARAVSPAASTQTPTERVSFNRRPVRVALPVGRERLITFASAVALHAPESYDGTLRLQIVGRTVYATALQPFGTLRIVAEDIEHDGAQIPIDLIADDSTAAASDEIEILTVSARGAGGSSTLTQAPAPEGADMVALTRYAARALYAPRRLIPADAAIRQVPLATMPVAGLYRGARVQTVPIGAWRSGGLYVTAVRFTNQERAGVELEMNDLRGQWLAATAQHARLAPVGDEADTTVVYLVCDQPFEACR